MYQMIHVVFLDPVMKCSPMQPLSSAIQVTTTVRGEEEEEGGGGERRRMEEEEEGWRKRRRNRRGRKVSDGDPDQTPLWWVLCAMSRPLSTENTLKLLS